MQFNSNNTDFNHKNVWKSPGYYKVPDILGNAYLKPDPPVQLNLRPFDPSKQISKRPWYPPNPYDEIPPLSPLTRHKLERKMRKSFTTSTTTTTTTSNSTSSSL